MGQIKINDWVTGYHKGYFQVYKIIKQYYDESDYDFSGHKPGEENRNSIVVLKQGFDSKLNKKLGWDSHSIAYCKIAEDPIKKQIYQMLKEDPEHKKNLSNYKIPPIKTVYNLNVVVKNNDDKNKITRLIDSFVKGKTFLEIKAEMDKLGVERSRFTDDNLLQFVCTDYEIDNKKRKIWREASIEYRI